MENPAFKELTDFFFTTNHWDIAPNLPDHLSFRGLWEERGDPPGYTRHYDAPWEIHAFPDRVHSVGLVQSPAGLLWCHEGAD